LREKPRIKVSDYQDFERPEKPKKKRKNVQVGQVGQPSDFSRKLPSEARFVQFPAKNLRSFTEREEEIMGGSLQVVQHRTVSDFSRKSTAQ